MATADEAIQWARRGFRVFPAQVRGKRPAIDDYPNRATTDEAVIRAWWTADYNVALAMGRGVVAIDLDTKHDTLTERVVDTFELFGGEWDTLTNRTVSGGLHVFYRDPREWKTVTGLFGKHSHVDVRAEGGYVIAPPSHVTAPEEFLDGAYAVERDTPLAPLPDTLAAVMERYVPREARQHDVGASDNPVAIASYADWLKLTAEPAIEGQGGDAQTYDVACMGVRDFGLTVETTYRLMLDHYNPRCQPPWAPDELLHKIENADEYAIGNVGSKDLTNVLSGLAFTAPAVAPMPVPVAVKRVPIVGRLLPDDAIPVVDWLVPYILQRGEVTLVSGPTASGKSSWMLGLACHAAVGQQYGPFEFRAPFSTMIYNAEDDNKYTSGRASATCILHSFDYQAVSDRLVILDQSDPICLSEKVDGVIRVPEHTIEQLNAVMAMQPDTELFIFDPLVACIRNIEENDNAEMNEVIRNVTRIANSYNVAILIGHHMRKGILDLKNMDKQSTDLARGAGATISTARISLNLLPQTPMDKEIQGSRDDVFSLNGAKANHGPKSGTTWWERRSITIRNGQNYPAPRYIQQRDITSAHWGGWIDAMGEYMVENDINELRVNDAAVIVANLNPDETRPSKSIANALRDNIFRRGDVTHRFIDRHGINYTMSLITHDDTGGTIRRGQFFTLVPLSTLTKLPPVILPPAPPQADDDISGLL